MSAYRENAAGEIEIFAHRWKTALLLGTCVLFTAGSVWMLLEDAGAWEAWLGLALFGVIGSFVGWRFLRRGFLTGKPMVVIGPQGIRDRNSGLEIGWTEVERIEFWEQHVRGTTLRYLGIWPRDPDAVLGRLGFAGRLTRRLPVSGALRDRVNVALSQLATTPEEFAGILRRFWDGPVEGYEGKLPDEDDPIRRRSRWKRFGGWAKEWAIALALAAAVGVPIIALFVWLDG